MLHVGNKVINRKREFTIHIESICGKPFFLLIFVVFVVFILLFFDSFTSIWPKYWLEYQIWVNGSKFIVVDKCVNSWILNKAMSQSFSYVSFFCHFNFTKIINIYSNLWLFTILLNYFLCFQTNNQPKTRSSITSELFNVSIGIFRLLLLLLFFGRRTHRSHLRNRFVKDMPFVTRRDYV